MQRLVCKNCGKIHKKPTLLTTNSWLDNYCDLRIPINVIGGFLGAGKTTLLNHILAQPTEETIDVLIREYGKISIDDQLLKNISGNVHVFRGFTMHDDPQLVLHDYLHNLVSNVEVEDFDRLLMETSGIDKPESLIQLFLVGYMPDHYRLGSYIVVVDGQYGRLNMEEYDIAVLQIAFADVIVINKQDLATDEELEELEKEIRKINAMAKIYRCSYGQVDLNRVMNIETYSQLKDLIVYKGENSMGGIQTIVLTDNRPMDKQKINKWIQNLFETTGTKILRSKGFFYFEGEDWRYEFQAVRKAFHSKADRCWEEDEERKSTVVLIGENLPKEEELRSSFEACLAV